MIGHRYLIALDPTATSSSKLDHVAQRLRALDMTEIANQQGLLIMTCGATKVRNLGERDWVIGEIFRKEYIQPVSQIHAESPSARANEKMLLRDYWGGYVSLLHGEAADCFQILRDPSGALPAYWTSADGLIIVASDVELMIAAGLSPPPVDWFQVAHFLMSPNARPTATCLEGISELRRGEVLSIKAAGLLVENRWSPWDYVEPVLSWDDARSAIRQSVNVAVQQLTQDRRELLLGLSGGLDSSIIAAALSAAGAKFTALTLATVDPAGDERAWASMVAGHLGIRLDEATIDAGRIDLTCCDASHLPRPVSRPLRQEIDRLSREQADYLGAEAHIGGAGGDSVFCHISSATALSDRLLISGARSGSWSTLNDLAAMSGVPHGRIIKQAFNRLPMSRRAPIEKRDVSMLSPELTDHPLPPRHPWLVAPCRALPGKWRHVRELIAIENHMDGLRCARDRPHIAPLMSQPVLEVALSVPTWLWCVGGMNRSAARSAFADRLPEAIINRRIKGAPDSVSARTFEMKRGMLQEFLIGGLLDRAGLLDRDRVSIYLRNRGPLTDYGYLRLLTLANAEAWARHWQPR